MKNKIIFIVLFSFLIHSCGQPATIRSSAQDPKEIFKNDTNFVKYYNSLKFSGNFIALDTSSKIISRGDFLREVSEGNFMPLKIDSNNNLYFRLFKANPQEDDKILIQALCEREYKRFLMEGKMLPSFNFTDLNGKTYTNNNMNEKILVLKLWFIGCVPCVQEFPAVNKIADQYKNRKDIKFIGLAFDRKEELKNFLKSNILKYFTIPDQKNYIVDSLKTTSFPTHVIVNKKGEIIKIVSTCSEMEQILKDEASKSN